MKIAIIGAGNMGGAIVRGLVKSGGYNPEEITCTARSEKTLERLRECSQALRTTTDNVEAARGADIIVLAVKPWLIEEVMEEIRPAVELKRQIIVSVAAGVSLSDMEHYLIPDYDFYQDQRICAEVTGTEPNLPEWYADPALFRVVPNTAAEVLESFTFVASLNATEEQVGMVCRIFDSIGHTMVVPERLIAAGTSLASCGIAFAMRYIRAAMEGGVELGFRPEEAARIVEHTVRGAASLLLSSGAHPEAEIDKVTTAGGITIKGLNAMEREGFTNAVIEGLKASR